MRERKSVFGSGLAFVEGKSVLGVQTESCEWVLGVSRIGKDQVLTLPLE